MRLKFAVDPINGRLAPEKAIGACLNTSWTSFLGIGITEEGNFEVVNSEMTAERALWLIKWAERWAMCLDVDFNSEDE